MNHRALVSIIVILAAVAGLFLYRDMYPDLPSEEEIRRARVAVYNQMMDTEARRIDASLYPVFFVPAADKALLPALLTPNVKILDGSESEIKAGAVVSKADGKRAKAFEVKFVASEPDKIVLLGKWSTETDRISNFKYTFEKDKAGKWSIATIERKLIP